MPAWGKFALTAAAALVMSSEAWGQTPEQTQNPAQAPQVAEKPTARDLAYKFVHDPNTPDIIAEARAAVLESIDKKSAGLSPAMKAWMKTAMTDAAETAADQMLPQIEERLISAYAQKFTVEELQQVLDFQVFVRQPRIAAAFATAQQAGGKGADTMLALQKLLPREDFERILNTTLKHPMLTVTMVTLQQTTELTKEFVQRFNAALSVHCATAPESVPVCKDQGRAL